MYTRFRHVFVDMSWVSIEGTMYIFKEGYNQLLKSSEFSMELISERSDFNMYTLTMHCYLLLNTNFDLFG